MKPAIRKSKYGILPILILASVALSIGPAGWTTIAQITAGVCRDMVRNFSSFEIGIGSAGILLAGAVLFGMWKAFTLTRHLSQFANVLQDHSGAAPTAARGDIKFDIVFDRVPFAFCHGLLKPRIYVSTALINILSSAELDAVLLHERAHQMRKDPLRIAVSHVVTSALSLLPGLSQLRDWYLLRLELRADQYVNRKGDAGHLRAAMLRHSEFKLSMEINHAPSAFNHLTVRLQAMEGSEKYFVSGFVHSYTRRSLLRSTVWIGILVSVWASVVLSTTSVLATTSTCPLPV